MSSVPKTGLLGDRSAVVLCALLGVGVAVVLGVRLRGDHAPDTSSTTAIVDLTQTYQTITGFGASVGYYQDWLAAHPSQAAISHALYGELNLDILRLRNTYEPGKPAFAAPEKTIFTSASKELGHAPQVFLSSWSPPAALKSTGETRNGGTLARQNGSYNYAGFAAWWHDSVLAYQAAGLAPDYVSIQNEPDWKDTWETCLFRPQETADYAGYDKALHAVYTALQPLPARPKLIGPETLGANNPQTFLSKEQAREVAAVAHHLYNGGKESDPDSFSASLTAIRDFYPDKPKFQTEFGRGDGFQTAWLIHNCLTQENASAYLYWAAVWPSVDALVTVESPWQKNNWKLKDGYQRTDRFYALEHFSRFIRPGYVRVAVQTAQPELKLSAYLSPDKTRLVAVAINTAGQRSHMLSLVVPGYTRTESYRTVAATKESFSAVVVRGEQGLELPPHALATLVYIKQGAE